MAALDGQRFCLKWNDFRNSVTAVFEDLRKDEELVDITLCCEGKKVKAHRMMLSACSPYFRDLLKENPCQHPVFFLKDTTYADLRAVIEFVYKGEVNVTQGQLSSFLKTAEMLQVRGLTGDDDKDAPPPASPAPPRPAPVQQSPRAIPRRPPAPLQPPMRMPPAKRSLPMSQPLPQKRLSAPMAASAGFAPEVVTMPDSPPPPPLPLYPAAAELPPSASPAAKRRRHSGSSSGEGPPTPADHSAPSPYGDSGPLPSPGGAPPQLPLLPQDPSVAPPVSGVGGAPQQPSGLVKVEKVDIADDDEGLAALGQVAEYEGEGADYEGHGADYEGQYDSDASLGAMGFGDNGQGGSGGGFAPGSQDGAAGSGGGWYPGKPCEVCGRQFNAPSTYRNHRALHRGQTTCYLCGRVFSQKSHMTRHMKLVHDIV